jgi:LPXTG-motif cell wall-anchored protein
MGIADMFGFGGFGGDNGGGGGGGGSSGSKAGGGFIDLSTSSNATTANYTSTENIADAYNETSNLAHNISGSANSYNVYSFGEPGGGNSLLDQIGLPLREGIPSVDSATGASKWLLLAGLAAAGLALWLYLRRKH